MADEQKRRVGMHNARTTKNGEAFTPKHNDRNFDAELADHIDAEMTRENVVWNFYDGEWHTPRKSDMTFEDAEKRFYDEHFSDYLEAFNAKSKAQRNYDQVKTMDEYRKARRTCPEETLFTLGTSSQDVDPAELLAVTREFLEWRQKTYPQCVTLDAALHMDEPNAAPHIHVRQVWMAWDEAKNCNCVNQNRALEMMGVERPHPEKSRGKYNNPKQTYTKACYEQLKQIAREHGIEIEDEPREASKSGLELAEFKLQACKAEMAEVEGRLTRAEHRAEAAEQLIESYEQNIAQALETVQSLVLPQKKGLTGKYAFSQEQFDAVTQLYQQTPDFLAQLQAQREALTVERRAVTRTADMEIRRDSLVMQLTEELKQWRSDDEGLRSLLDDILKEERMDERFHSACVNLQGNDFYNEWETRMTKARKAARMESQYYEYDSDVQNLVFKDITLSSTYERVTTETKMTRKEYLEAYFAECEKNGLYPNEFMEQDYEEIIEAEQERERQRQEEERLAAEQAKEERLRNAYKPKIHNEPSYDDYEPDL